MFRFQFLTFVILLVSKTEAFLDFAHQRSIPKLPEFAEAHIGTLLKVRFEAGIEKNLRLSINGLICKLIGETVKRGKHPLMPGFDGPFPKVSSGVKALDVQEDGSFVSLQGLQKVMLKNSCWEMIWQGDASQGNLVFGFDVPQEVKRNSAILPKGSMYMSFPVWTQEGLLEARTAKTTCEERARQYLRDRDEELARMIKEPNPLKKAWHYRNAAEAVEKYSMVPLRAYSTTPLDGGVIPVAEGELLIGQKGLVWWNHGGFRKNLGEALISVPEPKNDSRP